MTGPICSDCGHRWAWHDFDGERLHCLGCPSEKVCERPETVYSTRPADPFIQNSHPDAHDVIKQRGSGNGCLIGTYRTLECADVVARTLMELRSEEI